MPAFLTAFNSEVELAYAEGHSNLGREALILQSLNEVPVLDDHVLHEVLVLLENFHIINGSLSLEEERTVLNVLD